MWWMREFPGPRPAGARRGAAMRSGPLPAAPARVRRLGGTALVLLLAAQAVPAHAGDIAPPTYGPSERFVLDMHDARVGRCVAEPAGDYTFEFRCREAAPRTEDLGAYLQLPLRVGKSWTHHYRDVIGGSIRVIEASVIAQETVSVPAGTYETYRVSILDKRVGGDDALTQTCWYAPAIEFFVRCKGPINGSFDLMRHRE